VLDQPAARLHQPLLEAGQGPTRAVHVQHDPLRCIDSFRLANKFPVNAGQPGEILILGRQVLSKLGKMEIRASLSFPSVLTQLLRQPIT
jgi:hypothetical protein